LHNTVGIELQMITTFYVGYRGTRVRVYICLSVCLSVRLLVTIMSRATSGSAMAEGPRDSLSVEIL